MSREDRSDPAAQAEVLIGAIGDKIAQAKRAIAESAAREASAILQGARDKARRQLQRARADLQQVRTQRLAQVQAELDAAERRRASAQTQKQLAQAWPLLESALERRWREAGARARWIEGVLDVAQARLTAGPWIVRYAPGLEPAVCDDLRGRLEGRGLVHAKLEADAAVPAGLVIEHNGARLDATPAALLADRHAVEAALLAELGRMEQR